MGNKLPSRRESRIIPNHPKNSDSGFVRLQARYRGIVVRARNEIDKECIQLLNDCAHYFRALQHDPLPHFDANSDTSEVLYGKITDTGTMLGVNNPYARMQPSEHDSIMEPRGFVRVTFHAHGHHGKVLPSYLPDESNIVRCWQSNFRCVNIVANDKFVDASTYQELAQKLDMLIFGGAEYRLESGLGPHVSFQPDFPELTTICHPALRVPMLGPEEKKVDNTPTEYFLTPEMEGVRFMEVTNGWVRSLLPDSPDQWQCVHKWDTLLSAGVLVWGTGEDDAFQRFQSSVTKDPVLRIPAFESFPGFVWNEVFIPGRLNSKSLADAMLHGCFYFTTGVQIENIQCESNSVGNVQIEVTSYNADCIEISTDNGFLLASNRGKKAKFDPWSLLLSNPQAPKKPTYVRITLSYTRENSRKEYAWLQPFWLTVDGISLARDKRRDRVDTGLAGDFLTGLICKRFIDSFAFRHVMKDIA